MQNHNSITRQTERPEPPYKVKTVEEIQEVCKREFEKMDALLARMQEIVDSM